MGEGERSGVTTAWIGGLVLGGVGVGLGIIALTLPWVVLHASPGDGGRTVNLVELPGQAPVFALFLVVVGVLAAVAFSVGRRPSAAVRVAGVLWTAVPAVAALFVGMLPPKDVVLRVTEGAPVVGVSSTSGLMLYVSGLFLVGLGVAVAMANPVGSIRVVPVPAGAVSERRVAVARWVSLGVAVPAAVLSLTLAWVEVDGEVPAAAEGWREVYRVGLILVLVLLVGVAVTGEGTRRVLRAAGLHVSAGLTGVLALNAFLLWDPTGLIQRLSGGGAFAFGAGFVAAVVTVPLLAVVLANTARVSGKGGE